MSLLVNHDYTVNIQNPVVEASLGYNLYKGDADVHKFSITLYDGADPLSLSSASAQINVIREADGATVEHAADINGSIISAALSAEACAYPGRIQIKAEVTIGGATLTVLHKFATVKDGATDAVVDPGEANVRLYQASAADEYNPALTYALGVLCTKAGVLYECSTAIEAPEAWIAGHWTAVTVSDLLDEKAYKASSPTVDHIATLDAVGNPKDSGKVVGDFATAAQGAKADALSRQNILHNWYFLSNPINQRAASGDITSGYFYDRWLRYAGTITIAETYLSLPANASIEQRIEGLGLAGKVVAVGVMVGGSVIQGTGTFPTSAGTASVTLTGFGTATLGYNASYMYVRFTATDSTRQVQAVKLEMGTYSTLANDAPPDYGAELLKCMRYYLRSSDDLGVNSTGADVFIPASTAWGQVAGSFPVIMRTSPTITIVSCSRWDTHTTAITDVTVNACSAKKITALNSSGSHFTAGSPTFYKYTATADL